MNNFSCYTSRHVLLRLLIAQYSMKVTSQVYVYMYIIVGMYTSVYIYGLMNQAVLAQFYMSV